MSLTQQSVWEELGREERPSWYLDPLAAQQKRDVHLEFIGRSLHSRDAGRLLKTDLFEDAFGADRLLDAIDAPHLFGMDEAFSTVQAAARRIPRVASGAAVMDIRQTAFANATLDTVLSTSTLDHFETTEEFGTALAEIARILRPGGLLILTLDNAWNPLYHPLRWYSRRRSAPFPLGYTPSPASLRAQLLGLGFHIVDEAWLIHNPRGISTILFLTLRKLLGSSSGALIGRLLSLFALAAHLPTKRITACFFGLAAIKR